MKTIEQNLRAACIASICFIAAFFLMLCTFLFSANSSFSYLVDGLRCIIFFLAELCPLAPFRRTLIFQMCLVEMIL